MEGGQALVQKRERQSPPVQRTRYDTALKSQGPHVTAIREIEYVSKRSFQLKWRQAVMGTYLQRIRRAETYQCCECTTRTQMDTHNILFDCGAWMKERIVIRKILEEDGRGQPKRVRQLIGSRKVTPVVLRFIVAKRTGQRAQKQDQEQK